MMSEGHSPFMEHKQSWVLTPHQLINTGSTLCAHMALFPEKDLSNTYFLYFTISKKESGQKSELK